MAKADEAAQRGAHGAWNDEARTHGVADPPKEVQPAGSQAAHLPAQTLFSTSDLTTSCLLADAAPVQPAQDLNAMAQPSCSTWRVLFSIIQVCIWCQKVLRQLKEMP